MSYVDNPSPTGINDPSDIKVPTPQDHPPRVWQNAPEGYNTPHSCHLSKDNPTNASLYQLAHCEMETKPEHQSKGQKRKYEEESGTRMASQKTVKWEQGDMELQCVDPGKDQQLKNQEKLKTQKAQEPDREPQAQKSVDGGKGRKRPYSILEESGENNQKEKYGRYLQHSEDVNSDPHGAQEDGLDQLKTKSVPAQFSLAAGSKGLLTNKMSIPEEEPVNDQEKGRAVDDGVPHVTQEMEKEISDALGPGPLDEIVSRAFKLQITRGDIRTLEDDQWLNDTIINFYMNLLVERSQNEGYPDLHAFNTFFYPKLKHGGYNSVKRWTRGVNLFAKELILVPIHLEVHWSLVVIDLRKKSIVYLDSMAQNGEKICEIIFQYLQNESKTRRNIDLKPSQWKLYYMTAEEIPQQQNGSDCGIFLCKYAEYISRDQPVAFAQHHMPIFRKSMVWEILHRLLL